MTVYIVRAVGVNRIKVGVTDDLPRRLTELQAGCPVPLELVKAVEAGRDTEASIHGLMADFHCHNEWFIEDGALPIALRWAEITEAAAANAGSLLAKHLPPEALDGLKANLYAAGAKIVADALTNITGQSIMDRRYGT